MLPGRGRSSSEEIIFLWRALFSAAGAVAATGKMTRTPDEIAPMRKALNHVGPIIVGFHVDYSDNHKLFEIVKEETIHLNYLKSCGSRILERRRVSLASYRSCNYGTRTDQ